VAAKPIFQQISPLNFQRAAQTHVNESEQAEKKFSTNQSKSSHKQRRPAPVPQSPKPGQVVPGPAPALQSSRYRPKNRYIRRYLIVPFCTNINHQSNILDNMLGIMTGKQVGRTPSQSAKKNVAPRPTSRQSNSYTKPREPQSPANNGYGETHVHNGYGGDGHEDKEHHHHGNGHEHHGGSEHGVNGHSHGVIIEDDCTTVKISKSIEEIEREKRKEITVITREVIDRCLIEERDDDGCVIRERGHFLEVVVEKFKLEFVEKWKIEFLFPAIKCWLEKHIVEYIETIVRTTRERIIKEYEERIIIIKEKHRCDIIERERCHKELYCKVIKQAWEAYQKTMEDIEFTKEVRFRYRKTEEKHIWGEFIKELAPELLECVPTVYSPEFCIDDSRRGRNLVKFADL
jgi:hypothetical protein